MAMQAGVTTFANTGEFLGGRGTKKPRAKTLPPSVMAKSRSMVLSMMRTGDWSGANGRDYVALFQILHERVYGVPASELDSHGCFFAAGMAAQLVDRQFGGDPGAMVQYMRWVWEREVGREKWRRENPDQSRGGRIGYRALLTGSYFLTDYRIDAQRRKAKGL
jgi:hypothetical protein